MHQLDLFLAAVTRHVHVLGRFGDDLRAAAGDVVDHPADRLFVAGNGARRQHHAVAFLEDQRRAGHRAVVRVDIGRVTREQRDARRLGDQRDLDHTSRRVQLRCAAQRGQ